MPDPNENSSFPKAARAAGINYNEMINTFFSQQQRDITSYEREC